ncbi:unnamed protein product [Cuscuta epithymum]|uniref:Membrane protein of ER body-like protein n=1 Tax=Cuscuta epithymum TaxID=186058 RepID=A0AAV0FYS9_9ASTE|nr:unnamed protein product [Cuscuta epithymum]
MQSPTEWLSLKMENEGHEREPRDLVREEEEEEEEDGLLVRSSKSNAERGIPKVVKNCHAEKGGYADLLSVTENGAQESTFDCDKKRVEELVNPTQADRAEEGAHLKDYLPRLQSCVYDDKDDDGKSTPTPSIKECNGRNASDISVNRSLYSDLDYPQTLPQVPSTFQKSSTVEEIEAAAVHEITDSEIDPNDYDVESVLQKQNTHDLYCPNCYSCITRRVILRKRKRKNRISSEDAKRNKFEYSFGSEHEAYPTQVTSDHGHDDPLINLEDTPILDDYNSERGVFRCLSCFSFFTPTESGFKLFQIFGEKGGKENARDDERMKMKKSWFSSIFVSDKGRGFADQGPEKTNNEETSPPLHVDCQETEASSLISHNNEPKQVENNVMGTVGISDRAIIDKQDVGAGNLIINQFKVDTNHQLNVSKEVKVSGAIDESWTRDDKSQVIAERLVDGSLSATQTGLKVLVTSNAQSLSLGKKQADQLCDREVQNKSSDDEAVISLISPVSVLKGSEGVTKFDIPTGAHEDKGKDTIITVEEGPTASVESVNVPHLATQIHEMEQGGNAREGNKIEIIKSIVYGGLAELITSLSIVSSAAAGDTTTLQILALGLANLIGGFFIILNNLWELKKDCIEQASNQITEQPDRYTELLGKRKNFMIHAIVVLLSYILFGLVPPTVYAFFLRTHNDVRELKLSTAAAASLLCIILLAIGKAYAQRPPKPYLKTITFYVVLGLMVSGVSFGAGDLINRLLQKFGLFEPSSSEISLYLPRVTPLTDAVALASSN